jgi:hypothetical protein
VKWKGPLLALAGAAAVAGVAIGLTVGGGSGSTSASGPTVTDQGGTTVSSGSHTTAGHRLVVGTLDDSLKQPTEAASDHVAGVSAEAGFNAVLISSMWTRGALAPSPTEAQLLKNAIAAATKHDLTVFVFVWSGLSGNTPRTPAMRSQFAAYVTGLARAFPQVRHIVIGNEPNLNTFWLPQYGPGGSDAAASGYYDLLSRSYDALNRLPSPPEVIGGGLAPRGSDRPHGKRQTHSPTRFLSDLGSTYRRSARDGPIMDALATHPYMRTSKFPPSETHAASTTITIADYSKLVALLRKTFGSTAQRAASLPIYYTEFGVQTEVPKAHRTAYSDLNSPAAIDAVDTATQARYYREALKLAACQPNVKGLFILHTFDEQDLAGWQSGLYYADQQPKGSLNEFTDAAKAARDGTLTRCAAGTFVRTG